MNKYVMKFFIEKLVDNNNRWLRVGTCYDSFDKARNHIEFWHDNPYQVRIVVEMIEDTPPVSNNDFAWAMERMKEGKIVTRQSRDESFRIKRNPSGRDILILVSDWDQKCLNLMHDTVMAKDWVLADEENEDGSNKFVRYPDTKTYQ